MPRSWPILVHLEKQWTSPFAPDYCDETSQLKLDSDRKRAAKEGREYVPKPWEGFDYLNKEDIGAVHVKGFLYSRTGKNVDGTFTPPTDLESPELKTRISREWAKHSSNFPEMDKTHIRVIFSMSNEFHSQLQASGVNPDQAIKSIVDNSMNNFRDKFHEGDELGYIYGVHHDTDNLHVHVFIHPRTREGEQVSLSSQLARVRGTNDARADKLGFLKGAADRQVARWQKKVETPTKAFKGHLKSDRVLYTPSRMGVSRKNAIDHEYTSIQNQWTQLKSLDSKINDLRQAQRQTQANYYARKLLGLNSPWMRIVIEIAKEVRLSRLRALQKQRNELRAVLYPALKKRQKIQNSKTKVYTMATGKKKQMGEVGIIHTPANYKTGNTFQPGQIKAGQNVRRKMTGTTFSNPTIAVIKSIQPKAKKNL